MKHPTSSVLVALVGLMMVPVACAQERSQAEIAYDLLASIAGRYTYTYQEFELPSQTGKIAFELFPGGRFLKFDEEGTLPDGGTIRMMGIIGYDPVGDHFTWYRISDNGAYDYARGTLEGDTITFDFVETRWEPWGEEQWIRPGVRSRTKWMVSAEDGLARFVWEQSIDGGPWTQVSEGHNTRVR